VRRTRWILALLALTVLLVACSKTAPQNTMNPQGPTAQTEKNFSWTGQGIEIVILTGLILVMAVAILIWRRSERLATAHDRAER